MKWGFIPKDHPGPKYLCCNADESEPGTFKDRQLMERDPHQILEGIAISCYAIGAQTAYIYIRGEFRLAAKILERAIAEACQAGHLGSNIYGSGVTVHVYVHVGAGPISVARKPRCSNRWKANGGNPERSRRFRPRTASIRTHGRQQRRDAGNVPHIVNRGADWFASIGAPPKSTGTRVFCLSGHVKRPEIS